MTKAHSGGFWYKPHRGSLDDSMRELRRFEDLDDLFGWVAKSFGIGKDRLYLSGDSVWDERIGADLHYVGILMEKHHVPQCIGHAFWLEVRSGNPREISGEKLMPIEEFFRKAVPKGLLVRKRMRFCRIGSGKQGNRRKPDDLQANQGTKSKSRNEK